MLDSCGLKVNPEAPYVPRRAVLICAECGEPIYEGEGYLDTGDEQYHDNYLCAGTRWGRSEIAKYYE